MVYKIQDEKIVFDEKFKYLDTFIMHLYSHLINEGWMKLYGDKLDGNKAETVRIINNAIYCKSDESKSLDINAPAFNAIYNSVKKGDFDKGGIYHKFIKMLIS